MTMKVQPRHARIVRAWRVTYGAGVQSVGVPCIVRSIVVANTLNATRYIHVRGAALTPGAAPSITPWILLQNTATAGYYAYDFGESGQYFAQCHVGLSSTQATWTATTDGLVTIRWVPADE